MDDWEPSHFSSFSFYIQTFKLPGFSFTPTCLFCANKVVSIGAECIRCTFDLWSCSVGCETKRFQCFHVLSRTSKDSVATRTQQMDFKRLPSGCELTGGSTQLVSPVARRDAPPVSPIGWKEDVFQPMKAPPAAEHWYPSRYNYEGSSDCGWKYLLERSMTRTMTLLVDTTHTHTDTQAHTSTHTHTQAAYSVIILKQSNNYPPACFLLICCLWATASQPRTFKGRRQTST